MSSLCDKRGEAGLFIRFILVKTRKLTLLASNVYDLHFSKTVTEMHNNGKRGDFIFLLDVGNNQG